MQPQSGPLRGTSRRGAGGGQRVVRLSDGGQSHASARFPGSRLESAPPVSTACAVHGQQEHVWDGHTREQKVTQEQGAAAPGAWGSGGAAGTSRERRGDPPEPPPTAASLSSVRRESPRSHLRRTPVHTKRGQTL